MITLTQLVKRGPVKDQLDKIPKPNGQSKDVIIENKREYSGMEYPLIGTAMDYLIRFKIEREKPDIELYRGELVAKTAQELHPNNPQIDKTLNHCTKSYQEYVNNSTDTPPVTEALDLARMEFIVRGTNDVDPLIDNFGQIDAPMKNELLELTGIASEILSINEYAVLNPKLGAGNIGADADLITDDVLVDIKTTKNTHFKKDYWRQLVGYLTLIDIASDMEFERNGWVVEKPNKYGVYYARSDDLLTFNAEEVYDDPEYPQLKEIIMSYI